VPAAVAGDDVDRLGEEARADLGHVVAVVGVHDQVDAP